MLECLRLRLKWADPDRLWVYSGGRNDSGVTIEALGIAMRVMASCWEVASGERVVIQGSHGCVTFV